MNDQLNGRESAYFAPFLFGGFVRRWSTSPVDQLLRIGWFTQVTWAVVNLLHFRMFVIITRIIQFAGNAESHRRDFTVST